jgi:SAM-dependent methyltransferase
MKWLDRYLQKQRFKAIEKYLDNNKKTLDIGCNKGEFFNYFRKKHLFGVGVDPNLTESINNDNIQLIRDVFPPAVSSVGNNFDYIIALAVLEHIPIKSQLFFAEKCYDLLCDNNGKLLITVPSSNVDIILRLLKLFRMIDGIEMGQHYGFNIESVIPTFKQAGFNLLIHRRFQLGLNNLYVFTK